MSVDWDKDLLAPLMAEFGEEATLTPAGGGTPVTVTDGVFDEAYTAVLKDRDGQEVNTVLPVLGVRASLFATAPAQGWTVSIRRTGAKYLVRDTQPDGKGKILLLLNAKKLA